MDYKEIAQKVNGAKIAPLTRSNFYDFVKGAKDIFSAKGTSFIECFRPGYNSTSAGKYSFENGRPDWQLWGSHEFDKIEQKEIIDEGKIWINVLFEDGHYEVLGAAPSWRSLKFAFIDKDALYLIDEHHNGTSEHPWETLYVRL